MYATLFSWTQVEHIFSIKIRFSSPMFWLQENLILIKKMLKKCSNDQSFIRKRNRDFSFYPFFFNSRRSCFHQLLGCQMGHFCARYIHLCQIDSFGCNHHCWFCPTWYVLITWFYESWIFYLLLFYREKIDFSMKNDS